MVPTEPHPSQPCTERSTVWRVSMSAAEMELSTHYSHDSAPASVLRVLKILSSQLSEPDTIIDRQLPPTQIRVSAAQVKVRTFSDQVGSAQVVRPPRAAEFSNKVKVQRFQFIGTSM